jgi:glutamate-1-semialdehyde 2,1-aminomutase
MKLTKSNQLLRDGGQYIAGGVVSLNRKADPAICFVRASGSRLWDADDNEYIDYHAAFAPHLLGHNHPEVNAGVRAAIDENWSLMGSGSTPWEVQLGELLCESVPGLERVQIFNTGSEATAMAIRFARAHTGREEILTTLGGYNGWHDEVGRAVMPSLADIGPRVSRGQYVFQPISAGIPLTTQRRIHVVNFNDLESVEEVLKNRTIACVITEPVLQNVGVVHPQPGYLEGLRKLCELYGTLLIFDEVKTGFRSALGGYQSIAGVRPDLSVFGKAVASGYPLAVLGGRADIMNLVTAPDPAKRVLVAGTYNAHPISCAAAIATLKLLRRNNGAIYQQIEARAVRLVDGIAGIFEDAGVKVVIARNASAFCVYFMDHLPQDLHDILLGHDFERDRSYRVGLIERGVYHFPVPCKQGSVSAAHSDGDIDRTLEATREVVKALQ